MNFRQLASRTPLQALVLMMTCLMLSPPSFGSAANLRNAPSRATALALEVLPRISLRGADTEDLPGRPYSAFLLSSTGPSLAAGTELSVYQYEVLPGGGYSQIAGVYKTISTDSDGYSSFAAPSQSDGTKFAYRVKSAGSPALQSNYANDDASPWGSPYFQDVFDEPSIDANYGPNNDRDDNYTWHRNTYKAYRDSCSTNQYAQGLQKAHPSRASVVTQGTYAKIGSRWEPDEQCTNGAAKKQTGNIVSGWRNIDGNAPPTDSDQSPPDITYGVVAARVKLPNSIPNYTSVWLRPKPNADPDTFLHEMDIFEWFGASPSGQGTRCDAGDGSASGWSRLKSNVYRKWNEPPDSPLNYQVCHPSSKILNATGGNSATVQDEMSSKYHVFSVFWPTRASGRPYMIFLDGSLIRTIPSKWVSKAPAQIVMTSLINDAANDTTMNPQPMLVDWVRAWKCSAPCATTVAPN